MPIIKAISAPNGAPVTFHKALRASVDLDAGMLHVDVGSWATEDDFLSGNQLVWSWPMQVVSSALQNLDATLVLIDPFTAGSVVVDASTSLEAAQTRQLAVLDAAYELAIARDVPFTTAAGTTKTFQSDSASVAKLANCLLGWGGNQAVPDGFYWLASDDTRVTFNWADLQGLAKTMLDAGHALFEKLQDLKVQVRAATSPDAVKAVVWTP
jgi:hypothetical protein